ncbi:integral membrane protein [Xylariomycetidae sp. FL2044]|nr:integral membrane protein [Xylariomycetidae sp. FL2044]
MAANHREQLIAAMVVFLILDGAAVGSRVYVRTKIHRGAFGWDDAFLCLTYLGFIIMCGVGWTSMYYGYAAVDKKPYYDAELAKQFYFANQLTLYISSGLVKIAVALVLFRLAVTRRMRRVLIVSMVVVALWTVIMTIFASWPCAKSGASNWAGSATCQKVGYFRTSSNIVIDYFYALLPVYMLWNVQMKRTIKALVILLLGMGCFASAATIVKLVIIVRLSWAKGEEATGLHYDLLLWADIELGMAIFAASLAALRPLLKLIPRMLSSSNRAHESHESNRVGPYRELNTPGSEMENMAKKTPPQNVSSVRSVGDTWNDDNYV